MGIFEIRSMKENDIPIILEYQKRLDNYHAELRPDLYTKEGCNLSEDELRSGRSVVYVAVEEDKVVGYVVATETSYQAITSNKERFIHIAWLFVAEGYRARGIGTALMQRIFDDTRKLGYRRVTFNVINGNPAIKMYEKFGAKPLSFHMEINI